MRLLTPRFPLPLLALAGASAVLAGCRPADRAPELLPVKGRVLLGGAPLKDGLVTFHPDAGRGNASAGVAMGKVRPDGAYELVTGDRPGAAAGWYRVTVTVLGPPGARAPGVNPRYARPDATDLAVEVVPEPRPDQYELRLGS